jgi:hypothetical protein
MAVSHRVNDGRSLIEAQWSLLCPELPVVSVRFREGKRA